MNTVEVFREKLEKEADFRQWVQSGLRPWLQKNLGQQGPLGGTDVRWWSTPIMMLLSALAAKSMGAGNWGTLGAALGGAGAGFAGGTAARQLAQPGELKPGWWQDPYKKWWESLTSSGQQPPAGQAPDQASPTMPATPPTEQMQRGRPY